MKYSPPFTETITINNKEHQSKVLNDLIIYAKESYGLNIIIKESPDYDTFDKIFGDILPNEKKHAAETE